MTIHDHPQHSGKCILLLRDTTEIHNLRRLLDDKARFHDMVGKNPAMIRVYHIVQDVARVDATVLIEGETGTGKELVARAIHCASARKAGPFIAANCAGLTESLIGSQLFGHKRGAFTGAISDQPGLFEAANGGTLFLDEIGDIPPQVQTSLLRVLQEKEIVRIGESKPRKINVRILAATHHSLPQDVIEETFRADLLYRIRVARIQLPPLRERRDDIPLLAAAFLRQIQAVTGKNVERLATETLHHLMAYAWPGNIRELKSAIECAAITCAGSAVQPSDLPPEITQELTGPRPPTRTTSSPVEDERTRFLRALDQTQGNRSEAEKLLRMSRVTFYRRLLRLQIDRPNQLH